MANMEKYEKAFTDTLGISNSELVELKYQHIPEWDSVGHMALIAALEEAFGIMFDTDDIIDLSSFEKGKEILKKYNVEL
jgi:acyl carrier protein